ncbi:MAG: class C sortase [Coriobacteriales bacterium]|jgi:sortase A|nr:class C sortase [Coriobacteriales bacterium]
MKKAIVIVCILLLGAGVLLYPFVSNYLAQKNGSKAIQKHEEQVSQLDQTQIDAAWQAAETYNENLTGTPVHDPFLESSGMAMPEDYRQVLNIGGDNVMGSLEIPKISVDLPIYHGTSGDVLDRGVGHLEGSTLPIGGSSRHSVLSGHSGLPNARLLTDLTEMAEGDMFYINVLGQTLAYQVDQIKVVKPNETDDLQRMSGKDYCTLLTCTPYGINDHRLLVRGVSVPYSPEAHESIQAVAGSHADNLVLVAAVITTEAVLVAVFLVTMYRWRKAKKNRASREGGTNG